MSIRSRSLRPREACLALIAAVFLAAPVQATTPVVPPGEPLPSGTSPAQAIVPDSADALPGPSRASLLAEAERALANRNPRDARAACETLLERCPNDAEALTALGRARLLTGDGGAADSLFRAAEHTMPDSGFAEYGRGLLALASGDQNTARNDFRSAYRRSTSRVDAMVQEAVILANRYSDRRNALRRLDDVARLYPENPSVHTVRGRLLHQNGDLDDALAAYRQQLAVNPGSADAVLGIADVLTEERDYSRARDELYRALTTIQGHDAELALAIAVSYLGERHHERADQVFAQAFAGMDSTERALYEDISPIANAEQVAAMDTLSPARKQAFCERFWLVFDPTPITAVNERRLEHYRRVWYARTHFAAARRPWDDRGTVYVTYGEPDRRVDSRRALRASDPRNYHERFLFTTFGDEHFEMRRRAVIPPMRIPNAQAHELWGYGNIRLGANVKFVDTRGTGEYSYDEAMNYTLTGARTRFTSLRSLRNYSGYERAEVPVVDHGMNPLWFDSYLAQFRARDGRTEIDLYMGYPTGQLDYATTPSGEHVASIESGVAVFDRFWNPRVRVKDTVNVEVATSPEMSRGVMHVDRRTVLMAGGEPILLGYQARDLRSGRIQAIKKIIQVRDYSQPELAMSDIVVAREVTVPDSAHGSGFVRSGYFILPRLSHRFHPEEPVHVYFEVYNLTRGGEYSTARYEVTYTLRHEGDVESHGFWHSIARMFSGPTQEVGMGRVLESMHTTQYQRFRLDTGTLEPGAYTLGVDVRDLNGDGHVYRQHTIYIVEPE